MTTTVTTVTTVIVLGFGAAISLIAIMLLIGVLVAKEITISVAIERYRTVGRILNVGLVPLLLAFCVILGVKLFETFS